MGSFKSRKEKQEIDSARTDYDEFITSAAFSRSPAIAADEEPGFARGLLSEFEENTATLEMLKARRFRPVPGTPDFFGD